MPDAPKFYPGQPLRAADLNSIAQMVAQQFIGRAPIMVTKSGGRVLISMHDDRIISKGGEGTPLDVSPEDNEVNSSGHTHKGMPQPATYSTFPAIPTAGTVMINIDKGDPDDGLWIATAGDSAWTMLSGMTDKTGAPGT